MKIAKGKIGRPPMEEHEHILPDADKFEENTTWTCDICSKMWFVKPNPIKKSNFWMRAGAQ